MKVIHHAEQEQLSLFPYQNKPNECTTYSIAFIIINLIAFGTIDRMPTFACICTCCTQCGINLKANFLGFTRSHISFESEHDIDL